MKVLKRLFSVALALTLMFSASLMLTLPNVQAKATSVTIGGVLIQGAEVVVASAGTVASDDGMYHLVASDAAQVAPAGIDVAQQPVSAAASFTVPLGKDTDNSMLFKKFTICVMKGGALTPASNSMYITNPEACASFAPARMDYGKKGILPDLLTSVANKNQPADLGVKQINLNLPLSKIGNLAGYDFSVRKYNSRGIQVNMIILVDGNTPGQFVNPYSMDGWGAHNNYGLNAHTSEGAAALATAASYVAKHYSGIGYGQVDNFIIGNEVNAWWLWNYMNCGSNDVFMQEYANAFRVMYNGIKSENATANVYACIDHQWARAEASYYISGKEFITKFNSITKSQGNIDWRVAVHPYNAPLYAAGAWQTGKNVSHSQNSPYITMANLDVLTDFMCTPDMLSPTGAVRTVKCSEVGYSSANGEAAQAADLVYAYLSAENNRYIDGLVISRESDHAFDIQQGMASGITNLDGSHKMAYDFYKNVTDPNVIAQASQAAGVDLTTQITPR
ncbi:hypothetical protein SAMN04487830_104119 [Pseudobutyrivibrio sp. OR37]|uniref:DUF5722 domain-containing protein n=1 Tax=Pseudobutyrivibrio sp. OR37 TaxID=1798186 RepID=UPI0008EC549E|nr:DUF5722 domain-containing protein [Pseudobutyrivibrio sp. OR37]SFH66670.1 hypothetical protein SAMN04487830_104119 [Pseudobutyrivibrio sp. OR37]